MSIRNWFDCPKSSHSRPSARQDRPERPRRRRSPAGPLAVEALEVRSMLAAGWAPSITVGDASVVEGDDGVRYAAVYVNLSDYSAKTIQVRYGTADGTARAGTDYNATSGTLTFAPGETAKSILVPVRGDLLLEGNEQFVVNLSNARGAKVADAQGAVTIVDDDDHRPRVSIDDVWARDDGTSGTTLYTFHVSLSAPLGEGVSVNYATADGTATAADGDYLAASGTLTFAPGETVKTVTVAVVGNVTAPIVRVDTGYVEAFYVNLGGASGNVQLFDGQGVGTIHFYDHVTQPADPYPYLSESPNGMLYLGADGLIYWPDGTLYGDGTLG